MIAINNTQIEAMLSQIRALSAQASPSIKPQGLNPFQPEKSVKDASDSTKTDFSAALRSALDGVNSAQVKAENLGNRFAAGDDEVQLSDVMISMQKANITLQTAVQVRNRMVSAYQDIMNMQI